MQFQIKQGLFKLDIMDYHAILGVPLDADAREIRLRYLKIVPKLHPDTSKIKNTEAKEKANNILARLVNPAYQALSKEKIKIEQTLLLSQKAKTITREGTRLSIASDRAKSLAKTGNRLDGIYHKLINALAMDQYRDLETINEKIAQISEINLVYLIFKEIQKSEIKQQQGIPDSGILVKPQQVQKPKTATEPKIINSSEIINEKNPGKQKTNPIDSCIKRAEEYRDNQKYKDAVLELRDALQIDPNNGKCHGLLGLIYLKQNSLSLAKIHIEKACQADPKNPLVIEAKEALEKQTKTSKNQEKSATPKLGMFSNLFGKKIK
jgi:curved DNA-binding protein CbpA